MAFRRPTDAHRTWATTSLPRLTAYLTKLHSDAVKDLIAAGDGASADATLQAIAGYRAKRREIDEAFTDAAMVLIAAGMPPGRVARRLRVGRSRVQARIGSRPDLAGLIAAGQAPRRRPVVRQVR